MAGASAKMQVSPPGKWGLPQVEQVKGWGGGGETWLQRARGLAQEHRHPQRLSEGSARAQAEQDSNPRSALDGCVALEKRLLLSEPVSPSPIEPAWQGGREGGRGAQYLAEMHFRLLLGPSPPTAPKHPGPAVVSSPQWGWGVRGGGKAVSEE